MKDDLDKILNSNKILKDNIYKLINIFVEFYGEQKREEITKKFTECLYISKFNVNKLKQYIEYSIIDKTIDYIENQITKENLNISVYDLIERKQILNNIDNTTLGYYHNLYIKLQKTDEELLIEEIKTDEDKKNILKLKHGIYKSLEIKFNNIRNLLLKLGINNLEELKENINNPKLKEIDKIYVGINKIVNDYKISLEMNKGYNALYNLNLKMIKNKESLYYKLFVIKNINIVPIKYRKQIIDSLDDESVPIYIKEIRDFYFGKSLNSYNNIDCFSTKSKNKLLYGNSGYIMSKIIVLQIKFYKMMGFDLGNDYGSYIGVEEINDIIPPATKVDELLKSKEEYKQILKLELEKMFSFNNYREEINNCNYININEDFYDNIENFRAFLSNNCRNVNNKIVPYPILLFNYNPFNEYQDHIIIHELNHLYELNCKLENDEVLETIVGWDKITENINDDDTMIIYDHRRYELFNEIINELIAQDISQIMLKNNICIFNNQNSSKIKGGTVYEKTNFIVEEFYKTYKEIIIKSRSNGNINILLNAIGKENFEEMNDLFYMFDKNPSLYEIDKVFKDLEEGKESKSTETLKTIIDKRDKILYKMSQKYNTRK